MIILEKGESYEVVRQAYIETTAGFLGIAGNDDATAQDAAQAIFEFERQLATELLSDEEAQDFTLMYPMSVTELEETYPPMDWEAHFDALGLVGVDQLIVEELRYLQALDGIITQTPVDVLKAWLTNELVWSFATTLSEEIDVTLFAFDQVLTGADEQEPLERRVLEEVNDTMPDAVGKLNVADLGGVQTAFNALEVPLADHGSSLDAYHDASGIEPGDAMYLDPEERIVIW